MHFLVGIHAALGEIGALAFVWVFIELLNPDERRLKRAKIAALVGTLFLVGAWIVGGYYYVMDYGALVKPIIKNGPDAWAHGIVMETKEHIFLFLPFLAVLVWGLLARHQAKIMSDRNLKIAVVSLSGLIVLIAFAMAGLGFLITSGFRAALETKLLSP